VARPSIGRPDRADRPDRRDPSDRYDRHEHGWLALPAVVGLLCGIGLMMVLSASSVQALRAYGGPWVFFLRQLMWVAAGAVALAVVARVDYRRWRALAVPLTLSSLVLLVAVLIPSLGVQAGGASRWLGFGPLRFQPSELAKLALLLFAAAVLADRTSRRGRDAVVVRPVLLVTCPALLLILLQPDMGTAMVALLVVLAVLFVGGVPLSRMALLGLVTAFGSVIVGLAESYRRARIFAFLNPWKDPTNTGYQIAQSLVALGSGHFTGVGLGASRAKWGFLPNAHTDFIFAIIGEELGLLGTVPVIVLFGAFGFFGVRAALRAPDRFGMLLAAGVTVWVVAQAIVNIGAVIGILPVTGVPLPFVSFGGSSLFITMVAVGMLANVARRGAAVEGERRRRGRGPDERPGRPAPARRAVRV
jgi:cell division protein FtsW